MGKLTEFESRFWGRVDIKSRSECWLWTANKFSNGYGRFKFNRKTYHAHRLSYVLKVGDIPKGLCVCHKCDVKDCVNPNHLFLGTNLDNIADRHAKKRDATGDKNGSRTHPERLIRGEEWHRRNKVKRGPDSPRWGNPHGTGRGEDSGTSKLTEKQVREIRKLSDTMSYSKIANRYGVTKGCVAFIIRRVSWRHI